MLQPEDYLSIVFVVVGLRHHSWIGLLVDFFPWKLSWGCLVPLKLDFREAEFRSVVPQRSLGPKSEVHGVWGRVSMSNSLFEYSSG